jgi:hypothetical protein
MAKLPKFFQDIVDARNEDPAVIAREQMSIERDKARKTILQRRHFAGAAAGLARHDAAVAEAKARNDERFVLRQGLHKAMNEAEREGRAFTCIQWERPAHEAGTWRRGDELGPLKAVPGKCVNW